MTMTSCPRPLDPRSTVESWICSLPWFLCTLRTEGRLCSLHEYTRMFARISVCDTVPQVVGLCFLSAAHHQILGAGADQESSGKPDTFSLDVHIPQNNSYNFYCLFACFSDDKISEMITPLSSPPPILEINLDPPLWALGLLDLPLPQDMSIIHEHFVWQREKLTAIQENPWETNSAPVWRPKLGCWHQEWCTLCVTARAVSFFSLQENLQEWTRESPTVSFPVV